MTAKSKQYKGYIYFHIMPSGLKNYLFNTFFCCLNFCNLQLYLTVQCFKMAVANKGAS